MTQQQRDRLDEDNIEDRNMDVTRSERRQAVGNEDNNPSLEGGPLGDGGTATGSRPSNEATRDNAYSSRTTEEVIGGREDAATGSHAEGQYPRQDEGEITGGQMARSDQGGAADDQVGRQDQ